MDTPKPPTIPSASTGCPHPQVALQNNAKIAAFLPCFVYAVKQGERGASDEVQPNSWVPPSQVKSISHDLPQLHRVLHVAHGLLHNPFLFPGPCVRSLSSSVL